MSPGSSQSQAPGAQSTAALLWEVLERRLPLTLRHGFVKAGNHQGSELKLFWGGVFFRAAPAAYVGSQARGRTRAVASGLHHRNAGSEPHLRPIPQLMATLDP